MNEQSFGEEHRRILPYLVLHVERCLTMAGAVQASHVFKLPRAGAVSASVVRDLLEYLESVGYLRRVGSAEPHPQHLGRVYVRGESGLDSWGVTP